MSLNPFRKNPIPTNDQDLYALAKRVSTNYQLANFEVQSVSKAYFADLVQQFEVALGDMHEKRTDRNPAITKIAELRKINNSKIQHVKNYLTDKYGKDMAKRYYADFGIEKKGLKYILPPGMDVHYQSLLKLTAALPKHGFENNNYGLPFWQKQMNEYKTLIDLSTRSTEAISSHSAAKKKIKKQISESLVSIRFTIRGNSRGDYAAGWREIGFLDER